MLEEVSGSVGPLEIGIMYAHTCNIECRHCGIGSGPKNRSRMTLELAERCIREAAELSPKPLTIAFTGGEPFLFLRELERLIELSNELGLSTRVVTNGFWGRNPSRARQILHRLRLAGLDALNFSADKYHLEFLPAWILKNAIAATRDVGLFMIVNFIMNQRGSPAAEFSRLYDIPFDDIRLFNERQFAEQARNDSVPPEVYTKINLSYGRLIGLGRAAEYPEEHYLTPLDTFFYGGCSEVVNRPVIYPNGDLQACCCAGGKIAAFNVGNLASQSLAELIDIMRLRAHFRFINNFGPRQLYEVMGDMRPERPPHDSYASICDICVAATCDMAAQEIDSVLEHWALGRLIGSQLFARAPKVHNARRVSELIWPTAAVTPGG